MWPHIRPVLRAAAICLVLGALGACANPYEKFYQDLSQPNAAMFAPYKGEPTISYASGNVRDDVNRMFEQGYGIVGVSAFVAPSQGNASVIAQAEKVGASNVLVTSKYQSTVQGSMPITTPTTSTTYNSGMVNAYGSGGGYATGTYSGMSTTYGSQTTYMPYTVDRYEQAAYFFKPLIRRGLGVRMEPLTDQDKQRAQTNKGVHIAAVRQGSPAFLADILPGDVMLAIGGKPTYDSNSLSVAIQEAKGHEAPVSLNRQGMNITKKILIPTGTW